MNLGMDEVERVIKGAVSTGAAVVVIIMGPGNDHTAAPAGSTPPVGQVTTATVTPTAPPTVTPTVTPTLTPTVTLTETPTPAPTTTTSALVPGTTPTSAVPSSRTGHATAAPPQTLTTTPRPTTPTTTPRAPRDHTRTRGRPTAENPGTAQTTRTTVPGPPTDTATAGTTAAAVREWGAPTRTEDFDAGLDGWQVYDGVGNDGKGRRSPAAVTVRDGVLSLTGDASGTSGGLCWGSGRRYGRWEGRVRAPAPDPSYHATMLLWPDTGAWPAAGEIDFMELIDPDRRTAEGFVHHGADNRQEHGIVTTDATQWHNWAVEWTPSAITMYLDGRPWYRTTDRAAQPLGPMHLCVQLDWFPTGGPVQPSTLQVDWVREYGLGGAATATDPAGATGSATTRAEG